ncbi:hypothetical protein LTR78_010154 [Recurvomyces mirabilis]|uniref:Uncharacterized protein n=1 Tax=Recurvomyces mirabilis TaxID=574656 RepID=A0AAE0WH21_9PEZI|nr:hypothetical protein LTR78_010154 [Recurvomyces mirabilis]KAK5149945.1 hypothetical protein LTS14_010550 [Recurvomyces mirabilis]
MASVFETISIPVPDFTRHSPPIRSSTSSPPSILSGASSPAIRRSSRLRDTTIFSPPAGVLTEAEIDAAPMCGTHKEMALIHYHRLLNIIAQDDPNVVPPYTSQAVARVQLARMTVVLRSTISHFRNHPGKDAEIRTEPPAPIHSRSDGRRLYQDPLDVLNDRDQRIESLIHDLIDASFHIPGAKSNLCSDPLAPGHDDTTAPLVQESCAGGVDDFAEMWSIPEMMLGAKPLPDHSSVYNIGAEVDVGVIYRRGKTESNVLYHAKVAKAGSAFSTMGKNNRAARCGRKRAFEDEEYAGDEDAEGDPEYEYDEDDYPPRKPPAPKPSKKKKPNSKPKPEAKKPPPPKQPIIESWHPAGGEQPSPKSNKNPAPDPTAILGIARVSTWRLQFFKPAIDDLIRQHAEYEKMVTNTMVHGGESLTDVYVYFPSANAAAKVKEAVDREVVAGRKLQVIYV